MPRSASHQVLVRVSPTFLGLYFYAHVGLYLIVRVGSLRRVLYGDDQNRLQRAGRAQRAEGTRGCPALRGWWGGAPGEESTPPSGKNCPLRSTQATTTRLGARCMAPHPEHHSSSGSPSATPPMGLLASAAQLRGHSIDQRSTGPTGSRIPPNSGTSTATDSLIK